MTDITLNVPAGTVTVDYVSPTITVEAGPPSATNVLRKTTFPELIADAPSGGDDYASLQALINAAHSTSRPLRLREGTYSISEPLVSAPGHPGSLILFADNAERTTIKRTYTDGPTLVIGVEDALTQSSGSVRISGITFQHATQYTTGDAALDNRVTTEYAHLVLHGGQEPHIEDCRFHRMPIGILFDGVTIPHVHNCRFLGVWDHEETDLQEGVAGIKFQRSATHGPCKDAFITGNYFGGAQSPSRSVTYGSATPTLNENVGSKYGILSEDLETADIGGNSFGGHNENSIKFDIQSSQNALNINIHDNWFDAARLYNIDVVAASGTYLFNSQIVNNIANGQNNGEGFVKITYNASGTQVGSGLLIDGNIALNHVKAPVNIDGAINVTHTNNKYSNYNYWDSGTTAEWAAGAFFGTNCTIITSGGNTYGGGGNLASPTNNCKWGTYYAAATVGTILTERSVGLGKAGGSLTEGVNPGVSTSFSVSGTIAGFGTGGAQFFADAIGTVVRWGAVNGGGSATSAEMYVNNAVFARASTAEFVLEPSLKIKERAAAEADTAAYGQYWVKSDAPNVPMFTNDAGTDFQLAYTTGSFREKLTANRTYYVRTDGSNSNTGLADTAGGAFLTIQKAIDTIADNLDLGNFNVTIQVRAGTYTGQVRLKSYLAGGGTVTLLGDASTPANVLISVTGAGAAIMGDNGGVRATYTINGFKITTTTTGHCLQVNSGALVVFFLNLDFGAAAYHYLAVHDGGLAEATGNFTVSGNASLIGFLANRRGFIRLSNRTITYLNSPSIGARHFDASELGEIECNNMTFTNGGTVTGKRYELSGNGVIFTNGGGASYLPGDVAGTAATGGQYI